jgi:hypothetical protein
LWVWNCRKRRKSNKREWIWGTWKFQIKAKST